MPSHFDPEEYEAFVSSIREVAKEYTFADLYLLGQSFWDTLGLNDPFALGSPAKIRLGLLALGVNTVYKGHSLLGEFYKGCPFMVNIDDSRKTLAVFKSDRSYGDYCIVNFR